MGRTFDINLKNNGAVVIFQFSTTYVWLSFGDINEKFVTGAPLPKGKFVPKLFILELRIFNFECMITGSKVAFAQSDHTVHIE